MRTELGAEAEVPEGAAKCAMANRVPVALFKVDGKVYCLDNACTHVGGPLCRGTLRDAVVQCPLHGSRFDVRSGQVVGPPARNPVRSYPVTIEGGKIWIDIP